MRIDSRGNVGIGITPSAIGSSYKGMQIGSGAGLTVLGGSGAAEVAFNTYFDGTNYKYITTSPATVYSFSAGRHAWFIAPSGTAGTTVSLTQAMTLDSSGNLIVGGTSNSGAKLTVLGATSDLWAASSSDGLAINGLASGISVISTYLDTSTLRIGAGITQKTGILITGNTSGSGSTVQFRTGNAETMRLDSSGNLGIGTTTPGSFEGTVKTVIGGGSGGPVLTLYGGNATYSGIYFADGTTGNEKYRGFFEYDHASDALRIGTTGSTRATLDSSGNLGLGVTPSAFATTTGPALQGYGWVIHTPANGGFNTLSISSNARNSASSTYNYIGTSNASMYQQFSASHRWFNAPSGTAGDAITFTQAMTLDASGNLLVGTTSQIGNNAIVNAVRSAGSAYYGKVTTTNFPVINCWNAISSGDNIFASFAVDTGYVEKGTITYNRTAGLVAYNTTSDYRAKDIIGPVTGSGALIDSTPVYMGKMKGATQERPMFVAHETPTYAHTGEKDAVDADGNPVYQQMDAGALIPVMWAEIQSLRKRLADAGIA